MSSPGHDEAGVGAHVLVRRVLVMCARDILSTLIFPFTTLPNISTVMAGPFITTTLARRSPAQRHTLATFLFVLVNDTYVINKGRCLGDGHPVPGVPGELGPHGMFLTPDRGAGCKHNLCVGGIIAPSPPTRAPGFILFCSCDNKLWTSLHSPQSGDSESLMRPLA